MTFGELIGQLLGWLGDFVEWLLSWVPRYEIVLWNERGVRYVRGKQPTEVRPGLRWYWPWQTQIVKHPTNRQVLQLSTLALETRDGVKVSVGVVFTFFIKDVLKHEVENFNADESMAEVGLGALRRIVTAHTWDELQMPGKEGSKLEQSLRGEMAKSLDRFGVRVEACRPTDQVRLDAAQRFFGISQSIRIDGGE